MEFRLDEVEVANLEKWKQKLLKKHGDYGTITYSFSTTGIGWGVTVKSSLSKKEKNITNYTNW